MHRLLLVCSSHSCPLPPLRSTNEHASLGSKVGSGSFSIANSFRDGRAIYLDNQATSPMDPRVLDAMLPFLTERFGNPHSKSHALGRQAEEAVEEAREVRVDHLL